MNKEWTAEKFEPAKEHYDDFEDDVTYCIYCYDEATERTQTFGCCGEVHFATGKELNDLSTELKEVDRRMQGASQQYDPPMTQTEEYLLNKEREEEYRSNDY